MPALKSLVRCPRCGYKIPQPKQFTAQIREEYKRAFMPWKAEEDQRLMELVATKTPMLTICNELQRQPSAIKRRIELLSYEAPTSSGNGKVEQTWEAKESEDLKLVREHHERRQKPAH